MHVPNAFSGSNKDDDAMLFWIIMVYGAVLVALVARHGSLNAAKNPSLWLHHDSLLTMYEDKRCLLLLVQGQSTR